MGSPLRLPGGLPPWTCWPPMCNGSRPRKTSRRRTGCQTSSPRGPRNRCAAQLIELLGPDRVLTRVIDLVRYASDASPYRLIPKAVVMARDANDVSKVLSFGRRNRGAGHLPRRRNQPQRAVAERRNPGGRPAPLERGGGARRGRPRPGEARDRAGPRQPDPGALRAQARSRSRQYRHRLRRRGAGEQLGRDALRCRRGLLQHRPIADLRVALRDRDRHGRARRRPSASSGPSPAWRRASREIRDEIRADAELSERIRKKFRIKNTMGYRLCAFLDADEPVEIFRRLLIGSEGTLGFIAEAVLETVPLPAGRPSPGSTSTASSRRPSQCPPWWSGCDGRGADGGTGADGRRPEHRGQLRRTGWSCHQPRRRCWSSSARERRRARQAGRGRRGDPPRARD